MGPQGRSERVRIRSPERPARGKSLYRLSYPEPYRIHGKYNFLNIFAYVKLFHVEREIINKILKRTLVERKLITKRKTKNKKKTERVKMCAV